MPGKIKRGEGRVTEDDMVDGIIDSTDVSLTKLGNGEGQRAGVLRPAGSPRGRHSLATEQQK